MIVYRTTWDGVKCVFGDLNHAMEEVRSIIENTDAPDSVELEVIEMTDEEFENLPEFQGY